jgi:hypothetical protein
MTKILTLILAAVVFAAVVSAQTTQPTNVQIIDPATKVPVTALASDGTVNTTAKTTGPSIKCYASSAAPSAVGANGRDQYIWCDTTGQLITRFQDPCSGVAKTPIVVNIATATTTELTPSLAGSGNHYYICSIELGPTAGAQNFALTDDDSDGCGSVTSGLAGGTTAGTGWNFPANGGLSIGNGLGTVARTNGTNRVLCAVTSAAQQISGVIMVVAAP